VLNWADQFRRYDKVVAYCRYGMQEINSRCGEDVCKDYIHHGVDTAIYRKLPREEVLAIRKEIFGIDPEDFLLVTVARNQPRKLYPAMMRALKTFIEKHERGGRRVYWYIHAPLEDPVGWDLASLCSNYYGMGARMLDQPHNPGRRIIFDNTLGIGKGPSDEMLNKIYNAADVGYYIYSSEGWSLPLMESMAAGTPNIATGYSAPLDWAKGAALFVNPIGTYPDPGTLFMRAMVSPVDITEALATIYNDKELRRTIAREGLKVAQANDWESVILPQWEEYLDSIEIRSPARGPREVLYLSDADNIKAAPADTPAATPEVTYPKVSIIIPTHIGGKMLQQCIGSIRACQYPNYELIIVDNGSWIGDSKAYIRELAQSGVKTLQWRKKYQTAKVLNMAAKEASGTFLLFLDNDTTATPGFIHAMLQCFSNPKCGAASVRLVHPQSKQFTTGFDYDNCLGVIPSSGGEGIVEKAALTGSCMLVPTALFKDIGGFDESYLFLWQDIDLCFKIREKGLIPMCNTSAYIQHVGGVTRRYLSKAMHVIDHVTMIRKWWPQYIPRKKDGEEGRTRVAIIKLLTMGDALLITPMLPLIRGKHPGAYITLYTTELYADLFEGNPNLDEIKVVGPLDKKDFGPSWSLMAYDSIITNVLLTEEWDYCYPCNQLDFWMEYRRAGVTMAQTYGDMFGFKLPSEQLEVFLDEGNTIRAKALVEAFEGDGPIVVMHTTGGWDLKEWTEEGFKAVAEQLWNEYSARIFVVGAPNEQLGSMYVRNLGGKLSLRDIVALCTEADLYIGGDSGPLHLCKASIGCGGECAILGLFACTNPCVVGFDTVPNYITLQSAYAGTVNCGFPKCPAEEKAKGEGREYEHCSLRFEVEDIMKAAKKLLDRGEYQVQEHRKGANKCKVWFEDLEWRTELLEGTDPEDMCDYGKDI